MNNILKIRNLLQITKKPVILAKNEDYYLVQKDNWLFIFDQHNLSYEEDGTLYISERASSEAEFVINDNGTISVESFSELYQFNCCHALLAQIKLLDSALLQNGFSSEVTPFLDCPEKYIPKNVIDANFKLNDSHGCPGVDYSLEIKNRTISGNGTFIKYHFFEGIEKSVTTIEDVMDLYVTITLLINKACLEAKEDNYCTDSWLESVYK